MRSPRADIETLWSAAKKHDAPLVKQLLVRASAATGSLALVNEFHPRKGSTPLMAACLKRETEHKHPQRSAAQTVQVLLEFGADTTLRTRDRDADTALHLAAACNQVRSVEFMVTAGVDIYALNGRGHLALDVARWHRSGDVADVLTQRVRIHSGWLFVRTTKVRGGADNTTAKPMLRVWKKRWAVALACDTHHRVVELALFKDRDDARPHRVVLLRAETQELVAVPKTKWLDRHNMFRVGGTGPLIVQKTKARHFSRDAATATHSEPEQLEFAADSAAQQQAWLSILRRSVYGMPMRPGQLQGVLHPPLPSSSLPDRVLWQPQPHMPIVVAAATHGSVSGSATTPDSPYSLFGGESPAPASSLPLSPLGAPHSANDPRLAATDMTVSPAFVSAAQRVATSPRARDAPNAPSFVSSTDDLRLSELTFYEQPPQPLSSEVAQTVVVASVASATAVAAASAAAAKADAAALPRRSECVICMDAPRDALCVPCGHVAGCYPCLVRQVQAFSGCPICRSYAQTVVKLYEV